MVLVVIAHVERDPIQRTVVRVGFEPLLEHVVLGNEMASHGMQTHSHQRSEEHVGYHSPPWGQAFVLIFIMHIISQVCLFHLL